METKANADPRPRATPLRRDSGLLLATMICLDALHPDAMISGAGCCLLWMP